MLHEQQIPSPRVVCIHMNVDNTPRPRTPKKSHKCHRGCKRHTSTLPITDQSKAPNRKGRKHSANRSSSGSRNSGSSSSRRAKFRSSKVKNSGSDSSSASYPKHSVGTSTRHGILRDRSQQTHSSRRLKSTGTSPKSSSRSASRSTSPHSTGTEDKGQWKRLSSLRKRGKLKRSSSREKKRHRRRLRSRDTYGTKSPRRTSSSSAASASVSSSSFGGSSLHSSDTYISSTPEVGEQIIHNNVEAECTIDCHLKNSAVENYLLYACSNCKNVTKHRVCLCRDCAPSKTCSPDSIICSTCYDNCSTPELRHAIVACSKMPCSVCQIKPYRPYKRSHSRSHNRNLVQGKSFVSRQAQTNQRNHNKTKSACVSSSEECNSPYYQCNLRLGKYSKPVSKVPCIPICNDEFHNSTQGRSRSHGSRTG